MLQGSYVLANDLLGVVTNANVSDTLCEIKDINGVKRKILKSAVTVISNPFAYAALLQVKVTKKVGG